MIATKSSQQARILCFYAGGRTNLGGPDISVWGHHRRREGAAEVYDTGGSIYDLVAKIDSVNETSLRDALRAVKRLRGVTSTLTSIVYNKEEDG